MKLGGAKGRRANICEWCFGSVVAEKTVVEKSSGDMCACENVLDLIKACLIVHGLELFKMYDELVSLRTCISPVQEHAQSPLHDRMRRRTSLSS